MAKLFAKTKIIMPGDIEVPARSVFDATPEQAKQFDRLGVARIATKAEVDAAALNIAIANGVDVNQAELDLSAKPASPAPGDPQAAPKGKSA